MAIRKYKTYEDYIQHQKSKLDKKHDIIVNHDRQYEQIIYQRYTDVKDKKVLCLAARLGGEVRGFIRRGANAIGIDLNPGKDNPDVIQGDFHNIPFQDNTFDIVFCNSIDHVLYMDKFLSEARRVTKDIFILEITPEVMGNHSVRATKNLKTIQNRIEKYFTISDLTKTTNQTSCLSGKVFVYILKK